MRLLLLLSVATLAASAAAQRSVERENHPNGKPYLERSVLLENGASLLDGPYRRFFENGQLAVQGAFELGRPSGEWQTYHANGKLKSKGAFNKGARYGKWELFCPDEKLAATGSYSLGLRDQRWVYFDATGARDEAETGTYRA